MRQTVPPTSITEPIRKLCASIVAANPVFVPVRKEALAVENECFENVKAKINASGGELVHGWTIWEWPKVMHEGEFHACWKSPEGELIDITHKDFKQILFLPDHTRKFTSFPFDNKRQAIANDPLIHRFIDVVKTMKALELQTYNLKAKTFTAGEAYVSVAAEYDQLMKDIRKQYRPGK